MREEGITKKKKMEMKVEHCNTALRGRERAVIFCSRFFCCCFVKNKAIGSSVQPLKALPEKKKKVDLKYKALS